jgi:hypothetical protein
VSASELQRSLVARPVRRDFAREHDTARAHLDDRERMGVTVSLDADHVVQPICKHPYRPPAETVAITNRSRSGALEPRAAEP